MMLHGGPQKNLMDMKLNFCVCSFPGSNVMRSIHGVGELMSQVVLRGGGFLPATLTNNTDGDTVKTQTEPEKQDILVMDTKLKIIEILQVKNMQHFNTCADIQCIKHISIFSIHITFLPYSSS